MERVFHPTRRMQALVRGSAITFSQQIYLSHWYAHTEAPGTAEGMNAHKFAMARACTYRRLRRAGWRRRPGEKKDEDGCAPE